MIFVMENNFIFDMLTMTARRMDAPPLFGSFHIAAALAAAFAAIVCAVIFSERIAASPHPEKALIKVLSSAGWLLVILEVYKQLFLYFIVNGGAFDLWFFPFQLCSVPMYLCILLPFVKGHVRSTFLTFMSGYTFISAAAALIYPEDFLRPYVSLTVHGFLWHGILLFISLLIMICKAADPSAKGLLGAAGLFACLCAAAVCINAAAEPVMQNIHISHPEVAHDWAAMFYLNPYHISPQPLVGSVQKTAGIPAGLLLYALVIAFLASFLQSLYRSLPNLRR